MKRINTLSLATTVLASVFSMASFANTQPQDIHKGYSDSADYYEVDGVVVSNTDYEFKLWNPRGKSKEQMMQRARFLADAQNIPTTPEQNARADKARAKYSDAILINSTIPTSVGLVTAEEKHMIAAIERNRAAGFTASASTIYGHPNDGYYTVYGRYARTNQLARQQGVAIVKDADDIRDLKESGGYGLFYMAQDGAFLDKTPELLGTHASQGLKTVNFAYNKNNDYAGGGTEQNMGLTPLGYKLIDEAHKFHIIPDCSHGSNQTCIEAANYSERPIIASHSNSQELMPIGRNISDDAMRAIAKGEGAVCTVGLSFTLTADVDEPMLDAFARHVNHTGDVMGRDGTCFSTDYIHNIYEYYQFNLPNYEMYPPELGFGAPTQNIAAENIWHVVALLEDDYNWSEAEIRGFLGGNLMRVYDANW
ncbi:dipeptidase [Vibrio superstes]|nr:membrane dipeptidase [Vibrio superstes]